MWTNINQGAQESMYRNLLTIFAISMSIVLGTGISFAQTVLPNSDKSAVKGEANVDNKTKALTEETGAKEDSAAEVGLKKTVIVTEQPTTEVVKKIIPAGEALVGVATDKDVVPTNKQPISINPASIEEEAPKLTTNATATEKPTDKKKAATVKTKVVEPEYKFTDQTPHSYWMPAKASNKTDHVDWMFYAILGLSIFCFVAITVAVVYLSWRYRARPGYRAEPSPAHDNFLEIVWTVIPSFICVLIFLGGWKGYLNMTTAPGDSLEINVTGQKWVWGFDYALGADTVSSGDLHVPVNRPVKLIMRSEDVLHSLFIPALRLKQDVIPGRYSYMWFEADKPGVYKIYCAEYCGDAHSDMKTKVVVHDSGGYKAWLDTEYQKSQINCRELPEAEQESCLMSEGKKVFDTKGCVGCHTLDGSASTGPTYQGMWKQPRTYTDGTTGVVDENYVRESLLDPMAKIRSGFSPVMPTYKGKLKDKDIDALIFWMKTL